jgi:hypothetical protein
MATLSRNLSATVMRNLSVLAGIRTERLPHTTLEHDRYASPLGAVPIAGPSPPRAGASPNLMSRTDINIRVGHGRDETCPPPPEICFVVIWQHRDSSEEGGGCRVQKVFGRHFCSGSVHSLLQSKSIPVTHRGGP